MKSSWSTRLRALMWLSPAVIVWLVASSITPSPEPLDVEAFLADALVIDGNANYFSPNSLVGRPQFEADENGLSVKQATGIDVGSISLRTNDDFVGQKARLRDGRYSGAMLIETAADIDSAQSRGVYGVVFYTQVRPPFSGEIGHLRTWYDNGLRVFQIAGSEDEDPAERLGSGSDQQGGLTLLGVVVVNELMSLGVVVDVSHANEQTTLETTAIALERGVPITANHAPAYALRRFRMGSTTERDDRFVRGKTDAELRAIASTDGVVGIFCYGPWLIQHAGDKGTVEDFVQHLDYVVDLIGIDHVGIATDSYLDGEWARDNVSGDGVLDGPDRYRAIVTRLYEMGYSQEELRKLLGLNFLRVYRRVLQ